MPDSPANPLPRKYSRQTAAAVMFWIFLPVIVSAELFCFFYPFGQVQRQHRVVTTYQPVRAKVLTSRVDQSHDSHGVEYDAVIQYQYEVNGTTYQSDQITAIYISSSQEWAESLVATYKPGQPCDAFYDPANPAQAVLLRRHFFSPYREFLYSAFMWSAGAFIVLQSWFASRRKLTVGGNGWYAIAPEIGQRQRLLMAKVCTIAWYVFVTIPTVHYYLCVQPPHSHNTIFRVFYALGLIPLLFLIRYWRMDRNMDEAQLLVDKPEGVLGRPLQFSVTQMVRRSLLLKQASLRLECRGFKNKSNSVVFETVLAEAKERELHTGEQLTLAGEISLPSDQPPSGRAAAGKFDRFGWKLLLNCELRHAPGYSAEYRFEVNAPSAEMPIPAAKSSAIAEIRAIEPQFAGRIMSKRNFATGQFLTLLPVLIQLPSCILTVVAFLSLYPNTKDPNPLPNVPKQQLHQMLDIGLGLMIVSSVWALAGSRILPIRYIKGVAKREIAGRPDAIVQPDADSQFVEIVPRENWNRAMWKNEKDAGLLIVDPARREIRFEGDKERFRIPVDALLSCDVEKSVYMSAAKPTAPGYFMVVLRAQTDSGIFEAPIAPSAATSIFNSKARQRAAEALQAKIKALNPVMVTQQTSMV